MTSGRPALARPAVDGDQESRRSPAGGGGRVAKRHPFAGRDPFVGEREVATNNYAFDTRSSVSAGTKATRSRARRGRGAPTAPI
jgi:hypothetical protein